MKALSSVPTSHVALDVTVDVRADADVDADVDLDGDVDPAARITRCSPASRQAPRAKERRR